MVQDVQQQLDTLPQQLGMLPAIQQQLNMLKTDVKIGRAETANVQIRIANRFTSSGALRPVQKTVPGSGLALAQALAPDQATVTAINEFANTNPAFVNTDIGSSPNFFIQNIYAYEHIDCLKLIFFYNESMGIADGFELAERTEVVREWLSTF